MPSHPIKRRLAEMGGRKDGRTVKWLAGQIGCTPATMSNFMAGRTGYMNTLSYSKMLKVLGVGENYIYGVGGKR